MEYIYLVEHQEERFADIKAENGDYLQTWYEFLPEEVLDGTAAEHSIPLILCNHGGGDDPVQATDELGMISLAGSERIALVAPRYASDTTASIFDGSPFDVNGQTLPALVQYMLDTYPALDPGRVYATGYSMGGAATVEAVEWAPQLFAATVPMAAGTPWGIYVPTEEQAAVFKNVDVAMMFTTSEFDLGGAFDQVARTLGAGYQEVIARFAEFNELGTLTYDFASYPMVGFDADKTVVKMLNPHAADNLHLRHLYAL
ncbi:MAG TPA: prolyl oligopeptidase family serine peptidase [Candidatus Limiplasma sp.]|nr:prolyl oligopeptidase family serine peptidase [Candidatus Limiplasma sp.]